MPTRVMNGLDLQAQRIQNLGSPSVGTDAVTRDYVDGAIRGLDWKPEVIAASTGNVSLTAPGTVVDGITLAVNDRVLLKDQTAPAENGIYVWTGAAVALTRALDADSATELSGATVTVQRGTVNADRVYRITADDPLTLGTTAITLAQVGGGGGTAYTAGNGLLLTGSDFSVGAGTGMSVTADAVGIDTAVVVRKFAANVGGVTSQAVTHNLGTRDIQVTLYDATTFAEVLADYTHTDVNNITVAFAVAPAANAYRIVVQG